MRTGVLIVVDSSVWIANFRAPAGSRLQHLDRLDENEILVGDIVLLEVLRGARSDREMREIALLLGTFQTVTMLDAGLAAKAAQNYRHLREIGITIRSIADLIIGTFCIERGHALLHDDRDFAPMVEHLGLRLA